MITQMTKDSYCICNHKYIVYRYRNDYGKYYYYKRELTKEIMTILTTKRMHKGVYGVIVFENELAAINRYILMYEDKVVIPESIKGWVPRLHGDPSYADGEDPIVFGIKLSEMVEGKP